MKLQSVANGHLVFDNGYILDYWYDRECCEDNYPDFSNIADEVGDYDFDEKQLRLERVEDYGFRFGDSRRMFFVPCYSDQNGYYSSDITVRFFDSKHRNKGYLQVGVECEVRCL